MGTRALVITEKEKVDIQKLIDYAENNIITIEMLHLMVNGTVQPSGDNPNHVIYIPMGYRVVYTIEQQPMGLSRHISISVDNPGFYPNAIAIDAIIKEFGYKGTHKDCHVYTEREINAVNLIQPFEQ